MYKRQGLFDETFFAYFEDVDISWRANSLGYKNMYCPAAKCYHICGATTGAVRYNAFKSVQSGRNSILLPWKNMPFLMFVLNFPFLLAGYLLKVLVFGLRGFWKPYLQGAKAVSYTHLDVYKRQPIMAVVLVCVVETGMPNRLEYSRHSAAAISAENP